MNEKQLINAIILHKAVYEYYFYLQQNPFIPPFRLTWTELNILKDSTMSIFNFTGDNKFMNVELEVIGR